MPTTCQSRRSRSDTPTSQVFSLLLSKDEARIAGVRFRVEGFRVLGECNPQASKSMKPKP